MRQDQLSSQTPANLTPARPVQSAALVPSLSSCPLPASPYTMAYPLETARHHRPPPISIHTNDGPKDLPTSPFSVLSMSPTRSPTSPLFNGRPRGGKRVKSPPPSRSPIPPKVLQSDLETFAEQCRLWCVFNRVFLDQKPPELSYLTGIMTTTRRRVV